jgi:hypothetical protein
MCQIISKTTSRVVTLPWAPPLGRELQGSNRAYAGGLAVVDGSRLRRGRTAFILSRLGEQQTQSNPQKVQNSDPLALLERLAQLRESGALTEEEFLAKKIRFTRRVDLSVSGSGQGWADCRLSAAAHHHLDGYACVASRSP